MKKEGSFDCYSSVLHLIPSEDEIRIFMLINFIHTRTHRSRYDYVNLMSDALQKYNPKIT